MQASHQLRFLREWAVFGRALRCSVWELLGVALALLLLMLAYSHTGHLVRFFFLRVDHATHTHTHIQTQMKHNLNFHIIYNLQLHNRVKLCPPTRLFPAWLCLVIFTSHAYSLLS